MTSGVRVRFAPSPTGYLHVGGARTALFNWLFARRNDGILILRIEDTDVERSSVEMTQGILDAMTWLGLDWNEGPLYQSRRNHLYKSAVDRLLEAGLAYCCVCEAGSHSIECRERNLRNAEGAAVRFRVPAGTVGFQDAVYGEISIESDTIEDFVLLRTDGQPTYHISVVVDDIEMQISHVIRGADHISNTPKQILLYKALGCPAPVFAHVPLILGPDKTRLSKRHGATSVMSDQEMFDTEELIAAFSLEGVSKTNAVFNNDKLEWFNAQYIAKLSHERLMGYLKPEFAKAGLWRDTYETTESAWFRHLLELLRPRSRTLLDFVRQARIYAGDDVQYEAKIDPSMIPHLQTLANRLEALSEYSLATTEAATRGLAIESGIKAGALMSAARIALTGQTASPGMFDVMVLIGQKRTVERLRKAQ
jgi:glutamyl-tRNA synthetase